MRRGSSTHLLIGYKTSSANRQNDKVDSALQSDNPGRSSETVPERVTTVSPLDSEPPRIPRRRPDGKLTLRERKKIKKRAAQLQAQMSPRSEADSGAVSVGSSAESSRVVREAAISEGSLDQIENVSLGPILSRPYLISSQYKGGTSGSLDTVLSENTELRPIRDLRPDGRPTRKARKRANKHARRLALQEPASDEPDNSVAPPGTDAGLVVATTANSMQ